jgi:hypothetical protein
MANELEVYVLDGIKNGFNIVDSLELPVEINRRNYRSVLLNKSQAECRLVEEIDAGNYVLSHTKPLVVSALGAVPKDVGDIRIIHDLSRPEGGVNRLAWETSVAFTSVDEATKLISQSSFLAKIDLKSAYRSIPISESCFQLTGLHWKFGPDQKITYFFDSRLPFGASKSCVVFQTITDSICQMMKKKGYTVLAYIDDLLCVADSEVECQAGLDVLCRLVLDLGLAINWKKVVAPSRKLVFLGILINCDDRSVSLPAEKVLALMKLISSWDSRKKVTKLEIQKMVGKLAWASRVIRGGRTFYRRLIDLMCHVRENHHFVRISKAAREDLSWWKQCCLLFNGTCRFACDLPVPISCFATDACEIGGGAYLSMDWFYSNWAVDCPSMVGCHINVLELFTVVLALRRWGAFLRNCHVRVMSDNMATVAAVNKSTSRSAELMPLIREIFWIGVKYNITLSCVHIPGKFNTLADRISRFYSFHEACDARIMLANFSNNVVTCRDHMSESCFNFLQNAWMLTSWH